MREPRTEASGEQSTSGGKAPYRSPRLTVYGDLSRITAVKGGIKGDGTSIPVSKA